MIARLSILVFSLISTLGAAPVRDYKVLAELIPETGAIVPGSPLTICLNIKHDAGWHTYWKNPGIAGVPIGLKWDLPAGFRAGEIQWARPQRVKMAIYNTFGYEEEVTLLIDIETPADLQPGSEVTFKAQTNWMMCSSNECHPSTADLSVTVPVAKQASPHPRGKQLADATRETMPVKNTAWEAKASLHEKSATLTLTRVPGNQEEDPDPDDLYLFCDDGLIDSHQEQVITREAPGVYKFILPRAEFGPKEPRFVSGVLVRKSEPDAPAIQIRAKITNLPSHPKKDAE